MLNLARQLINRCTVWLRQYRQREIRAATPYTMEVKLSKQSDDGSVWLSTEHEGQRYYIKAPPGDYDDTVHVLATPVFTGRKSEIPQRFEFAGYAP